MSSRRAPHDIGNPDELSATASIPVHQGRAIHRNEVVAPLVTTYTQTAGLTTVPTRQAH